MPSSRRRSRKKTVAFQQLSSKLQSDITRFKNNDCRNVLDGTVVQRTYERKDGRKVQGSMRKNGSRSINTVFRCHLTKSERKSQREQEKTDPALQPPVKCTENQITVPGYYRFDSKGNAYAVEGFCRDVKLRASDLTTPSAPAGLLPFVEQKVKQEKEKKQKADMKPLVSKPQVQQQVQQVQKVQKVQPSVKPEPSTSSSTPTLQFQPSESQSQQLQQEVLQQFLLLKQQQAAAQQQQQPPSSTPGQTLAQLVRQLKQPKVEQASSVGSLTSGMGQLSLSRTSTQAPTSAQQSSAFPQGGPTFSRSLTQAPTSIQTSFGPQESILSRDDTPYMDFGLRSNGMYGMRSSRRQQRMYDYDDLESLSVYDPYGRI
jgi:hypothetical protein